jgi:hypothetical protein
MFETCGQTADIALQLHAATKAGAALLSEAFDLVAGREKRGAGVVEQAVELGTADAVSGERGCEAKRHVDPTFCH